MKVIFAIFVVITCAGTQSVNYIDVPYYVTTYYQQCEIRYSRSCWVWGLFCSTKSYNHCWTASRQILYYNRVCKPGWSYPCTLCTIPVCDPGCPAGKTCYRPNSCQCLTTNTAIGCKNVPCSDSYNCYPGTCIGGKCQCDTSFNGTNCELTRRVPEIKECKVKVTNIDNFVRTFDCSSDGTPSQIFWIKPTITEITVDYKVSYEAGPNVFPAVDFIKENKFGIVNSKAILKWNNVSSVPKECQSIDNTNPLTYKECSTIIDYANSGGNQIQDTNTNVNITVEAKLGGTKLGANNPDIFGSKFQSQSYSADSNAVRAVTIHFDKTPPTHCLSTQGADCPLFPIQLDNDITTNSRIKATVANWTDTGSGIANYTVEIFFLQLNPAGIYTDPAKPLQVINVEPEHNEFFFDVPKTGVYSIVVTVKDLAGNEGKARNILTYSSNNNLRVNPDAPVRCTSCSKESDYKSVINSGINKLTFDWTNHFISDADFDSNLGLRVEPWNKGIDDVPSTHSQNYFYGARTIHEVNKSVALNYKYGYIRNPFPNQDVPNAWSITTNTNANIDVGGLSGGDVITFFVSCTSLGGFTIEENQNIIYDNTPLSWGAARFGANVPDESNSRVYFKVYDLESGVKNISYSLTDTTRKIPLLQNQVIKVSTRQSPINDLPRYKRAVIKKPCNPETDNTCYCAKIGNCYNYEQYFDVEHCLIDKYLDDNIEAEVTATNYAGQKMVQTFSISQTKDIKCRDTGLSSGAVAGIIIGVLIGLILIILLIIFLVWVFVLRRPLAPYDNLKKRFTRSNMVASADNELYTPGLDDTGPGIDRRQQHFKTTSPVAFVSKANDMTDLNSDEINSNDLIIGEELSSSNFIVSKAMWITPGKRVTVATKGMKRGVSGKNKDNLRNKIEICRKIPDNINLLKFFGAIENFKGSGPVMVMEYCPMTLKEWLERAHPTPDVLDDMSLFCLNISKGVEFLHDNRIIHKRISLRNVLLAKYYDQYIAKIIGYGQKADADSSSAVPIRWLSPETLLTLKKDRPTYNEKTDAWSFGITIWEIYTFGGKKPYPDLSNDDAQAAIKCGTILENPDAMPETIYKKVMCKCCNLDAPNRPNFQRISDELEEFRSGGGGGGGANKAGYYTSHDDYYAAEGGYREIYNDCR